jgi:Flp pilus assembly protein protease CpaA
MIADTSWLLVVLSRWVHVLCACLVVGGTFFVAMFFPRSTSGEDESIYLRSRRGFKMVVHVSTLFLLVTGIYNAILNWSAYRMNMPLTHGLFGPHVLFALISLTILMVLFARNVPGPGERKWLRVTVVILFLTVLLASSLKYAREHPKLLTPSVLKDVEYNHVITQQLIEPLRLSHPSTESSAPGT